MTICIAARCRHDGKNAVVLCADYQGTRGDFIKADDTYKFWHFHQGTGAIAFAGDVDCGREFSRRFTAVTREFQAIKKTKADGDADLRVGQYLAKARTLVAEFKRERIDYAIKSRFGISLTEYYTLEASRREPEILRTIQATDLGAQFLIAYLDDEEPIFIRIERDGYISIEDSMFAAIGSGEPFAVAIFSQIEQGGGPRTLTECLTWVYQAKLAAQNNPYVGTETVIWILFEDGREVVPSDEAWDILANTPGLTLAPIDSALVKLKDGIFKTWSPGS